jgi:hypothetical protein
VVILADDPQQALNSTRGHGGACCRKRSLITGLALSGGPRHLGSMQQSSRLLPTPEYVLMQVLRSYHCMTGLMVFEEVGGAVTNAVKICLCSTDDDAHTVFDETPSLNGKPCNKGYPGHGTYQCF